MKEFGSRLSSRKFLLAVGLVITACANHQYAAAAAAGIGYLASEGFIDYKAVNTAKQIETQAHDLAVQILAQLNTQQQAMAGHPSAQNRRSGDRPPPRRSTKR